MFLDRIDERNTCNPFILQFEEVEKIGLTGFGKRLSLFLDQPLKIVFFTPNEMIQICFSIMPTRGRRYAFFFEV
jgi:hypothetical protein